MSAIKSRIARWSKLKEKLDKDHLVPGVSYVVRESARWGVLNIVGGAILFFMLPHLMAETGVELMFATGIVLAGVQLHHFFVDGVIWKLKNPRVQSPTMTTLRQLTGAGRRVQLEPEPVPVPVGVA